MDQNKVDKRVGAQRLAHAHRTFGGRRIVAMAGNQHAIGLPLAGIRPIGVVGADGAQDNVVLRLDLAPPRGRPRADPSAQNRDGSPFATESAGKPLGWMAEADWEAMNKTLAEFGSMLGKKEATAYFSNDHLPQ